MAHRLELRRSQVLAFRRRVGALDQRLPSGATSLRRAAWAGLQDSMPRAALLSLHARLENIGPDALDEPSLTQLWGPRFNVYVVAETDVAVFTLGRLPDGGSRERRAHDLADRLDALLGDERWPGDDAGPALGVHPNAIRYAAPTGRVRIRWDGARQPHVWMVQRPDVDPAEARLELARRYLHVLGPGTGDGFAKWAGVTVGAGDAAFDVLGDELTPVRTPVGDGWILAGDEEALREEPGPAAPARLLPSGDAYYLLWGAGRTLLVDDEARRDRLWTSRVWPGAVLVDGEIVGTWRRAQHEVTVAPWQRLSPAQRDAVEQEAASLPLPGPDRDIGVRWT